jgi:hypothetical protein
VCAQVLLDYVVVFSGLLILALDLLVLFDAEFGATIPSKIAIALAADTMANMVNMIN